MGYSALLQRSRPGAQVGRRTLARPLLLSQRQAGAPTRLARPASPEVRTSTVAPWLVAGGACPRCRGAWRAVARGVWAQPSALWRLGGRGRGEACAAASPRAAARRGSLVVEKLVWVILGGVCRAARWRARAGPWARVGAWVLDVPSAPGPRRRQSAGAAAAAAASAAHEENGSAHHASASWPLPLCPCAANPGWPCPWARCLHVLTSWASARAVSRRRRASGAPRRHVRPSDLTTFWLHSSRRAHTPALASLLGWAV